MATPVGLGVGVPAVELNVSETGGTAAGSAFAELLTGAGSGVPRPRIAKYATTIPITTTAATPIHIIGSGFLAPAGPAGAVLAGAGAAGSGGRALAPDGAATVMSASPASTGCTPLALAFSGTCCAAVFPEGRG